MKTKYKILIGVAIVLFLFVCAAGVFGGYYLLQYWKNNGGAYTDILTQGGSEETVTSEVYTYSDIPQRDKFIEDVSNGGERETEEVEEPDQYKVKILSLSLIPLKDGKIDTTIANNNWGEYDMTLKQVQEKVSRVEKEVIDILEEGTCYKKYQSTDCKESLSYEVIEHKDILKAGPISDKPSPFEEGVFMADYNSLLLENEVCDYVDNKGVYEIWIWDHTGIKRAGWTSNFYSKYGDFSNSDGDPNDMPVCDHSYTVYEYNYGREADVAVEDHIFQFERIFSALNYDLFWNRFVGSYVDWNDPELPTQTRRCGWANYAPNSVAAFDWGNETPVESDCMNWDPDGLGKLTELSCEEWGCTAEGYFTFWMQNVPGAGNELSFGGQELRNFWAFIGDFDKAVELNPDLVK